MTWLDPTSTRDNLSWHVSRRVPVAPADATRALGEAIRAGALTQAMGSALAVEGVCHVRTGEVRGLVGRLRLGRRFRSARVEIEVEPWSHSESALGLRPVRRPPRVQSDRYFASAVALLAALEACLLEHVAIGPEMLEMKRAS